MLLHSSCHSSPEERASRPFRKRCLRLKWKMWKVEAKTPIGYFQSAETGRKEAKLRQESRDRPDNRESGIG